MTKDELSHLIEEVAAEGERDRGWLKVAAVLRALADIIIPKPAPAGMQQPPPSPLVPKTDPPKAA